MLSVVIPSFNRKESVLALLADLYRQQGVEFEVIVVDDCSPDGSFEAIQEAFPQVINLRNEKNGGPAVTRNHGILAAKGDIVVGFDSDVTVPDSHVLAKVKAAFDRMHNVDGLAFRLLEPDGVSDDVLRWWHPLPIETHASKCFETSYFSGTAYAFRRQKVVDAGLFPEWLYMHFEEVLLAYRLIDNGGVIAYSPELTAVHHANPTPRRSRIKTFYKPRNQILLALVCYTPIRGLVYIIPRLVLGASRAMIQGHIREFGEALSSAKSMFGGVKQHRKPLKKATWEKLKLISQGISYT